MVHLGRDDLVLTASSIGHPGFASLLEAAAAGGFAGLSLWPADAYTAALASGLRVSDMHELLDEHRLVVHEIDAVVGWAGPNDPGPPYLKAAPASIVYESAVALGAHQVNAVIIGDRNATLDDLAGTVGAICDEAARHDLAVGFEFARASALRSLADLLAVRAMVPEHDVRATVDAWQLHWGPSTLDDLRAAPGSAIRCVQIDDAPAERPADLLRATYEGRLVPGRGAADLVGLVRTLDAIGYDGPLTVETINAELIATHDPVILARILGDATRAVVHAAGRGG